MDSVTICARKLGYVIQKKKTWKSPLRKDNENTMVEQKRILQDIDLCATPGEVLFIMGPSGSGKTTLLNLLSGHISTNANAKIEGEVLFNNVKADRKMISKLSNYVMQKSTLLEFLTVEETLLFNAALRMKGSKKAEQKKRVEMVIDELKLNQCKKVLIGGQIKKGLSGGEMRRVSIAIELLDDPHLLFLDEPTSGLDASLAFDTLKLLVTLAKRGNRTIICTVHQPRSQAFSMFDQLLLLSSGKTVYYGPAKTALDHFQDLGYPCPPNFNPADFLLDLLTVCTPRNVPSFNEKKGLSATLRKMVSSEIVSAGVAPNIGALAIAEPELIAAENINSALEFSRQSITQDELDALPTRFQASQFNAALQTKIAEATLTGAHPAEMSRSLQKYVRVHTGKWDTWVKQTYVLTHRGLKNSLRNPIIGIAQLCISIITALILGSIFFNLESGGKTTAAARNIFGFLFFLVAQFSFSSFESLITFPQERILFNRDTANGTYSPSAFFVAKNISDLAFQHIPPLFFILIIYPMSNLTRSFHHFLLVLAIGSLVVYAASSFMYCVGTLSPNLNVAQAIAPVILVIFMLVSGFYLRDPDIPAWIGWLKWLSFLRFGFFALAANQFPPGGMFGTLKNDELLQSVAGITEDRLWLLSLSLFSLGSGYRIAAFIFLKYTNRRIGIEG
ncbi:ATP-binding cassette G family transporter [Cardiosporidium cionae]|uniref:ATP-binding cassette G family transporter n=1 Tax=Cardiosporidium cionae TaxID=476202 RepID=A0ABQ7J9X7_9APIC|nr:ATP-binding cassette G family transporter [Cardiosporidium cionae]|eukprot:KAF8820465.1 ATP-binding cassette G family transporter [Cardiosporidium cionae]